MKKKELSNEKVLGALYLMGALTSLVFVSIRLDAFIYQVLGISYPPFVHIIIAFAGGVAFVRFYGKLQGFLNEYCRGAAYIIMALISIFITYVFRGILIFIPIDSLAINSNIVLSVTVIGGGLQLSVFLMVLLKAIKHVFSECLTRLRSLTKWQWLFLLLLFAALNIGVKAYLNLSREIYFWDNAGYWETTHILAKTLRESPAQFLGDIYRSVLNTDYNYIIALPGSILCAVFGRTRYVFLTGIVNIYVFPFYVMVYLFIKNQCTRPIPAAICVILLFPIVIFLNVNGFIGVGGLSVCFLALILFLRNRENDSGEMWEYFFCGCLLALAILLRRWYAYFVLSFIIAAAADSIIFKRPLYRILTVLLPLAFVLLFFFQTFVSQRMLANYGEMYAAYHLGLGFDFSIFSRHYGLLVPAAAIFSAIILIVRRETPHIGCFLLIEPALCFLLFVRIQSHGQQHLLLYAPAFFYLCALLMIRVIDSLNRKISVTAISLICCAGVTVNCIMSAPVNYQNLLPSLSLRPSIRIGTDDILEINAYIDGLVEGTDKQLGVLASSQAINREVFVNAEISLLKGGSVDIDRSYIVYLPAVDSRDSLPYSILYCDYVMVCSPIQTHLGEDNQQVVVVPAKSFLEGTDIAQAFELNKEFYLPAEDVTVYIYEKVRDITEQEEDMFFQRLEDALSG